MFSPGRSSDSKWLKAAPSSHLDPLLRSTSLAAVVQFVPRNWVGIGAREAGLGASPLRLFNSPSTFFAKATLGVVGIIPDAGRHCRVTDVTQYPIPEILL
jgi:hypothetical protein